MTCGVYKITNLITNKSYIGVSIHIEQRQKEHQKGKGSKTLFKDFLEYGIKNFTFEILEECSEEELYIKEPEYIKYYNSYLDGYNENPGGADNNLQAILATRKKIYCYDFNGNFIKEYDSIADAERDTKIPNSNISKAAKGIERKVAGNFQQRYEKFDSIEPYKRTVHYKTKPSHSQIPVNQYNLNGELLHTYNSITEAASATKANVACIGEICKTEGKGKRKTSGGYIQRYAKTSEDDLNE